MPGLQTDEGRSGRAIAIRSFVMQTPVERRSCCTRTAPHSARPVPPVASRSHPRPVRQVPQSRHRAIGAMARSVSEAEVVRRLVNPSRATSRSRSRRAYRHISSLRSVHACLMIVVRQAGSFHTGRSAQSLHRRKPAHPVTSVTAGPEPRFPADFDPHGSPPRPPWPSMPWLAACLRAPRLLPSTLQHRAPRPASSDRDPRPPARPVPRDLA
jgi:hypothetical protein